MMTGSLSTRKRRTGRKRGYVSNVTLIVYCGACQNKCLVDVSSDSSQDEINQVQFDTFYVCADCTPEVERLEKEESLCYFQSHLIESVVLHSSHK